MNNQKFTEYFNLLIENRSNDALENFTKAYQANLQDEHLLHGQIISYLFCNKFEDLYSFLNSEKEISTFRNSIRSIFIFLKSNQNYANLSLHKQVLNLGIFIGKEYSKEIADLYFRAALILEPENSKALTALAETSLREGNFDKGIRLYSEAALKATLESN